MIQIISFVLCQMDSMRNPVPSMLSVSTALTQEVEFELLLEWLEDLVSLPSWLWYDNEQSWDRVLMQFIGLTDRSLNAVEDKLLVLQH